MKSVSVLVLMMVNLGFFQVVISSDADGSKSPKYKADERAALYFAAADSKSPRSPNKSPKVFSGRSYTGKGNRNDVSRLEGLSVEDALKTARS